MCVRHSFSARTRRAARATASGTIPRTPSVFCGLRVSSRWRPTRPYARAAGGPPAADPQVEIAFREPTPGRIGSRGRHSDRNLNFLQSQLHRISESFSARSRFEGVPVRRTVGSPKPGPMAIVQQGGAIYTPCSRTNVRKCTRPVGPRTAISSQNRLALWQNTATSSLSTMPNRRSS